MLTNLCDTVEHKEAPFKTSNGQAEIKSNKSYFQQIIFLTNKNFILARRNIVGTLGEILVALLFVLILFFIRLLYDVTRNSDQSNTITSNPINKVVNNINISTDFIPIIYYYPNNAFVLTLVQEAYRIIQTQVNSTSNVSFYANSKLLVFDLN